MDADATGTYTPCDRRTRHCWVDLESIRSTKSYGGLVHSYPILVFSLLVIFLFGYFAFLEWPHKPAFFAWVLPYLVALHLLLTRGQPKIEEFRGALPIFEDSFWDGTLTWLASGIAYSIGAVLANTVATHKLLVLPPHSERAGK